METGSPTSASVLPASLVGREAELPRLNSLVDDPSSGFRGVLLEGDPGIGKTVLWQATVEQARRRGRRVLVARPAEWVGKGDPVSSIDPTVTAAVAATADPKGGSLVQPAAQSNNPRPA